MRRLVLVSSLLFTGCAGACHRDPPAPTAKPLPSQESPAPSTSAQPTPSPLVDGVAWGAPVAGLRLGIALEANVLVVHLENVGAAPLTVMSHVATHERQNDWLSVTVAAPAGAEREIAFDDDRDKSATVPSTLAPGARLTDRWDLDAWAVRKRNGARPLGKGELAIRASYRVSPSATAPSGGTTWSGVIESGRVVRR